VDDPTRILRAVRYEQRFDFEIDSRTLELLDDALDLLEKVTPARIRHELERILEEESPEKALVRLDGLGVLERLQNTLTADDWLALQYSRLREELAAPQPDPNLLVEPIPRLYFGLLTYRMSEEADVELIERLGLRGETQRLVEGLEVLRVGLDTLRVPGIKPSEAVRILDRTNATARSLVRLIEEVPALTHVLDEYERVWKDVRAELDGNDLAAMGVPKGPVYGQILTNLRAGRLDGEIHSREEEVSRVEQMLRATEDHEAPPV
jgi:tRNA nucleotidyltransferase (CCA-adding enzyme)